MLIIFSVYAVAFWYGSKLVREEGYSVADMMIVCMPIKILLFYYEMLVFSP